MQLKFSILLSDRSFKRFFSILVFVFGCAITTHAGGPYKTLLWEITGNGMQKPSYLYGTMHVSNKVAFYLGSPFFKALSSVDKVALELDPEPWFDKVLNSEMNKLRQGRFRSRYNTSYLRGTDSWNAMDGTFKYDTDFKLRIQNIFKKRI